MPSACLALSPIWFHPSATRREKPYLFVNIVVTVQTLEQGRTGCLEPSELHIMVLKAVGSQIRQRFAFYARTTNHM